MVCVVADVGNSRLKWGLLAPEGDALTETVALPLDDPASWQRALDRWGLVAVESRWAIASVNPALAEQLRNWLESETPASVKIYRSAEEVVVSHRLERPEATGVDRALAVAQAIRVMPAGQAGQVISCGSAFTVEWISPEGIWQGGAIAPGLGLMARALHQHTAQLPLVVPQSAPPRALGAATIPAQQTGLFWGAVGALRELTARQRDETGEQPWQVWTGGDAPLLAPHVAEGHVTIRPDLVLEGLAFAAFGEVMR